MKAAFDPARLHFEVTETHELIPRSKTLSGDEQTFFQFLGKMLAKAIYSEILLEPQFSPVFLNQLLDRPNQIDDMAYLDSRVSCRFFFFICAKFYIPVL
jgi:ubiquitin-protein ligase E3 C